MQCPQSCIDKIKIHIQDKSKIKQKIGKNNRSESGKKIEKNGKQAEKKINQFYS